MEEAGCEHAHTYPRRWLYARDRERASRSRSRLLRVFKNWASLLDQADRLDLAVLDRVRVDGDLGDLALLVELQGLGDALVRLRADVGVQGIAVLSARGDPGEEEVRRVVGLGRVGAGRDAELGVVRLGEVRRGVDRGARAGDDRAFSSAASTFDVAGVEDAVAEDEHAGDTGITE